MRNHQMKHYQTGSQSRTEEKDTGKARLYPCVPTHPKSPWLKMAYYEHGPTHIPNPHEWVDSDASISNFADQSAIVFNGYEEAISNPIQQEKY